ncbi:MAG: hypothetical protein U9O82_11035 [Thermodesulfobacteriota bacterium]|nr:hypothetical protein [Thermodesulfobacteriota bacterium]
MSFLFRKTGRLVLILSVLGSLQLGWQEAAARDWYFSPELNIAEKYDSNIFFSRHDPEDDWITQVTAGGTLAGRSERSQCRLDAIMIAEKYLDNDDLDETLGDIKLSLSRWWSPKFQTTWSSYGKRDTTLETVLEENGKVTKRENRYRYGSSILFDYKWSERLSFDTEAGWSQSHYPDEGLTDLDDWFGQLNVTLVVSEKDAVGALFRHSTANYDDFENRFQTPIDQLQGVDSRDKSEVEISSGSLFWKRVFNETTQLSSSVGYRRTRNDIAPIVRQYFDVESGQEFFATIPGTGLKFDPFTGQLIDPLSPGTDATDSGLIFNVALDQIWSPRLKSELEVGRQDYFSTEVNSTERTFIRVECNYQFNEKLGLTTTVRYDYSTEKGETNEKKNHNFSVIPYLSWQFAENISVSVMGAYYCYTTEDEADEYNREKFSISCKLRWTWPGLFGNH